MTPREQIEFDGKWISIRRMRNHLITEVDWTQIPDCALSVEKREKFKVYRQVLRDIPQTYDNPDDVIWPAKPTL